MINKLKVFCIECSNVLTVRRKRITFCSNCRKQYTLNAMGKLEEIKDYEQQ